MLPTEDELLTFLRDQLGVDTTDIDGATLLFSSGIIDSFALVSLITFVESRGGVRVNPTDVRLDNFDSMSRILAFIESARRTGRD